MNLMPEKITFYDIIVQIVIPLVTFVIGILAEKKWKASTYFFKIISKNNHNNSLSFRQDAQKINNNFYYDKAPEIGSEEDIEREQPRFIKSNLYSNQNFIIEKFKKGGYLFSQNNAQFETKYNNAYEFLNNGNTQACASEYSNAFHGIICIFEKNNIYGEDPPSPKLIENLKNNLAEIRKFSNGSRKDIELESKIKEFEGILLEIISYMP